MQLQAPTPQHGPQGYQPWFHGLLLPRVLNLVLCVVPQQLHEHNVTNVSPGCCMTLQREAKLKLIKSCKHRAAW